MVSCIHLGCRSNALTAARATRSPNDDRIWGAVRWAVRSCGCANDWHLELPSHQIYTSFDRLLEQLPRSHPTFVHSPGVGWTRHAGLPSTNYGFSRLDLDQMRRIARWAQLDSSGACSLACSQDLPAESMQLDDAVVISPGSFEICNDGLNFFCGQIAAAGR